MNTSETIPEHDHSELKVTFYPPLFLQRRIWILDTLRAESVTEILDVGCGEGQLLAVLCQPAPWLTPPPPDILPPAPETLASHDICPSTYIDEIPNLHPTHIYGIDTSSNDLAFAVQGTAPHGDVDPSEGKYDYRSYLPNISLRWDELEVDVWKGGLEVINEEFIDVECIISTEVIEHLSPDTFPSFAPALLGVYHPRLLLLTTPSYTFNARFTAPTAPQSAREGFADPTGRTDRIFRHHDHKFEWTTEEFQEWCQETALRWGYEVQTSSVGRATEVDEWGRDEELGGATLVAVFRRSELENREDKGREVLKILGLRGEPHELLAKHIHPAHPNSKKPKSLEEIGLHVKAKMEGFREAIMRIEELWFEQDIALLCGGWIEILVRAVDECEFLVLKRDGENKKDRGTWAVELIGGVVNPRELWPVDGETSLDHIPADWMPGEAEAESSEGGWDGSTDMEGDISWNGSEDEDEVEWSEPKNWSNNVWGGIIEKKGDNDSCWKGAGAYSGWCEAEGLDTRGPHSSVSSTTGWDGDESDDTS